MFLIKIYQWHTSSEVYKEIKNIIVAELDEDIVSYDTFTFEIPIEDWLIEFQKVQITKAEMWIDRVIFEWYISEIQPNLKSLVVQCKWYKAYMNHKRLFSDKTYNQSINLVLEDLLNTSNWRTSWVMKEDFKVYTTRRDIVNKQFKRWDNYFDIIDELAELLDCQWTIKEQTLYFEDTIWQDRSTWDLFEEFVYDPYQLRQSNITNVSIDRFDTIITSIIWTDWVSFSEIQDSESQKIYWFLDWFESFREWDLSTQTQAHLDKYKQNQKLYKIEVEQYSTNVSVWDKVYFRVQNHSSYLDFEWSIRVIRKKTKFEKQQQIVTGYWFSDISVVVVNLVNKINKMKSDITKLKL